MGSGDKDGGTRFFFGWEWEIERRLNRFFVMSPDRKSVV